MIKIWYSDFWAGWDPYNNWFNRLFLKGLDYTIDPNPDILIYSCFGNTHQNYGCKKIYWTGENTRPPIDNCDLSMGFDFIEHQKYLRTPLYVIEYWNAINEWNYGGTFEDLLLRKKHNPSHTKFCAFIYGNTGVNVNSWGNYQDGVEKRNRMFEKLNRHKKVDSLGTAFNNTGIFIKPELSKIKCVSDYKFTFAIENSSYPGYVTEKIIDPMISHSIPLYWGSERIEEDFTGGYINLHKIDEDDAIEYILELDANPEMYNELYFQPYLEKFTKFFDLEIYRKRIQDICE